MQIILASASPRRRELMGEITKDFLIIPADINEELEDGICAEQSAEYLSVKKAKEIAKTHPQSVVVGCDTVVVLDNEILGKPKDKEDARRMISSLAGKKHLVITGCALVFGEKTVSFSEFTEVEFLPISKEEIEEYINSSEPYDKAGGYAIQGQAGKFVKGIKGDFNNVVGLPVDRLKKELDLFLKEIL